MLGCVEAAPLGKSGGTVQLEIVEDRYEGGSTLITNKLPIDAWHDVIGEQTFADAILARLVHNAYRVQLDGQSFCGGGLFALRSRHAVSGFSEVRERYGDPETPDRWA